MYKYRQSAYIKLLSKLKVLIDKSKKYLDKRIREYHDKQTEMIAREVSKLITKIDTRGSVYCAYINEDNVKVLTQLCWDSTWTGENYIDLKTITHLSKEDYEDYEENCNFTSIEGIFDNIPDDLFISSKDYSSYKN